MYCFISISLIAYFWLLWVNKINWAKIHSVNYTNVLCCVDDNCITDSKLTVGKLWSVGDNQMSFFPAAHSWGMVDPVEVFNPVEVHINHFYIIISLSFERGRRNSGTFHLRNQMGRQSYIKSFQALELLFCFYNLQLIPSGVLLTIIKIFFLKIPNDTSFIHVKRNVHSILPYIVVMNSPIKKKSPLKFCCS